MNKSIRLRAPFFIGTVVLWSALTNADVLEEEILIPTAQPNIVLATTLTLPRDRPPVSAVLLLPVAGPADRDLSLGPRGIYHKVARMLAERGIASLRLASRGIDGSGGDWLQSDFAVRLADTRAALDVLQYRESLAGLPLGAIGMSEGAGVAVSLADSDPRVAFVVALSMPVADGITTMRAQMETFLASAPAPEEKKEQYRHLSSQFLEAVQANDAAAVEKILGGPSGELIIPQYGFVPRDLKGRVSFALSPWYRSQVNYNIDAALQRLNVPLFAAWGTLDLVVVPLDAVSRLEEILQPGDQGKHTIKLLEDLNHLMMPAKTGNPTEYASLPEIVSVPLWNDIIDWIQTWGQSRAPEPTEK